MAKTVLLVRILVSYSSRQTRMYDIVIGISRMGTRRPRLSLGFIHQVLHIGDAIGICRGMRGVWKATSSPKT